MKFKWEKPDGTLVEIESPDEIITVLKNIKSRHDAAVSTQSKMEAAALEVQHQEQYNQWFWFMAFYYQEKRRNLRIILERSKLKSAWWDQCLSGSDDEDEVSEIQRSLLEGLPSDLWPSTWGEAARILNRNPDTRLPSTDLNVAKKRLSQAISIAGSCQDLAEHLAMKFARKQKPEQDELDEFHTKLAELEGLIDAARL